MGCLVGGNRGARCPFPLPTMVTDNERLFLYFEVPRWNGTSRSNLCNAQKLADDVWAYFADEELW